jgi:hypothetical protein
MKKKVEPDWVKRNRERSIERYHKRKFKYNLFRIVAFVMFGFALTLLFLLQNESRKNSVIIDSIQFKSDSIRDELFSTEIELSRYQITLENMDSVTKEKFESFLYTQTE